MDDTDISVSRLTEARTFVVTADPDTVILKITADGQSAHYMLPVAEFARLARQMSADAMLLTAGPKAAA